MYIHFHFIFYKNETHTTPPPSSLPTDATTLRPPSSPSATTSGQNSGRATKHSPPPDLLDPLCHSLPRATTTFKLTNTAAVTVAYQQHLNHVTTNPPPLPPPSSPPSLRSHATVITPSPSHLQQLPRPPQRFGAVSFSSYSKGDMKFKERVFPHRVCLSITSLDLVSVIEDEEYFSHLYDEDAIQVCLLLCLEVIFMAKLIVKEVNDTLMRLVESLKAWNTFPWELNHAFLELVESSFIASVGTQSYDDTKEECHETEDFLLEKEFMRRLLEEERLFLEEERLFEEEKRVRLEDQKSLKLEQECELQVKKRIFRRLTTQLNIFRSAKIWTYIMVFIPINETGQHWCLVEFDIKSGVVTFYDCGGLYDLELKDWYIGTRDCLKVWLPEVLEPLNVSDKKRIEKSTYHITFRIADNVPKQGVSLVTVGSGECLA
nr:phospholipase-like protein [Tanacetum cinerariifolium]